MHAHRFIPDHHPQYEKCAICGTFHSIVPFPKENYLDNYWDESKGHSTLQDQRYNLEVFVNENGESKVQAVLKHVKNTPLLEIACAPGSFLRVICDKFHGSQVVGIEPDSSYLPDIQKYVPEAFLVGKFFEDVKFPKDQSFKTIVAMDLLEHLEDGQEFIKKAMSLLEDGGRLILMLPLEDNCRPQDFCPEHLWLYSRRYIKKWLNPILIEDWIHGHSVVVVEKGA